MFLSINLFEEKYTLRISLSFCASIRKRENENESEKENENESERENENESERERERERGTKKQTERERISFVRYIVNFSWIKLILIYSSSIFVRKKLHLALEKLTRKIVRTRE